MNTPHKHAALIKAWADGAEIQFHNNSGNWQAPLGLNPAWDHGTEYRVKPEVKPNTVTWHNVFHDCVNRGWDERESALRSGLDRAALGLLRIEIDHNDPANPVLVSAILEKP